MLVQKIIECCGRRSYISRLLLYHDVIAIGKVSGVIICLISVNEVCRKCGKIRIFPTCKLAVPGKSIDLVQVVLKEGFQIVFSLYDRFVEGFIIDGIAVIVCRKLSLCFILRVFAADL